MSKLPTGRTPVHFIAPTLDQAKTAEQRAKARAYRLAVHNVERLLRHHGLEAGRAESLVRFYGEAYLGAFARLCSWAVAGLVTDDVAVVARAERELERRGARDPLELAEKLNLEVLRSPTFAELVEQVELAAAGGASLAAERVEQTYRRSDVGAIIERVKRNLYEVAFVALSLASTACGGDPDAEAQLCELRRTECRVERRECNVAVRQQVCTNEFDRHFDWCLQKAMAECDDAFDLCEAYACDAEAEADANQP